MIGLQTDGPSATVRNFVSRRHGIEWVAKYPAPPRLSFTVFAEGKKILNFELSREVTSGPAEGPPRLTGSCRLPLAARYISVKKPSLRFPRDDVYMSVVTHDGGRL